MKADGWQDAAGAIFETFAASPEKQRPRYQAGLTAEDIFDAGIAMKPRKNKDAKIASPDGIQKFSNDTAQTKSEDKLLNHRNPDKKQTPMKKIRFYQLCPEVSAEKAAGYSKQNCNAWDKANHPSSGQWIPGEISTDRRHISESAYQKNTQCQTEIHKKCFFP